MKKLLLFLVFILSSNLSISQHGDFRDSKKPNVKKVEMEEDLIFLNKKAAYKYKRVGNDFSILKMDGQKIIEGNIENIGKNKFKTLINFIPQNVKFSNSKIVGRNDLVFALVNFNVFEKNGTINEERLKLFLDEYNELKM